MLAFCSRALWCTGPCPVMLRTRPNAAEKTSRLLGGGTSKLRLLQQHLLRRRNGRLVAAAVHVHVHAGVRLLLLVLHCLKHLHLLLPELL